VRIGDFGRDAQFPLTYGRMCLLPDKTIIYSLDYAGVMIEFIQTMISLH